MSDVKDVAFYALMLSDVDLIRFMISSGIYEPDEEMRRQLSLFDFTDSDTAYRTHYEKWEGEFYDGPHEKFIEGDWRFDQRFCAIYWTLKDLNLRPGSRVLDFGCSTGHITRTLAEALPKYEFVGVDIIPDGPAIFNDRAPPNAVAYSLQQVKDRQG